MNYESVTQESIWDILSTITFIDISTLLLIMIGFGLSMYILWRLLITNPEKYEKEQDDLKSIGEYDKP